MNLRSLMFLLLVVISSGCGSKQKQEVKTTLDRSPLTVEQWNAIPPEEKFDAAILERLRAGSSELAGDDAWRDFENEVIAPELRKATGPQTGKTAQKSNDPGFFEEG